MTERSQSELQAGTTQAEEASSFSLLQPLPTSLEALFAPSGVADSMPLAVIALNPGRRIIGWNRAAEILFGWRAAEVLGQTGDFLIPEALREHVEQVYQRVVQDDTPVYNINENFTRDGRTLICEWHNTLLHGSEGQVVALIAMARDITSQQKAERERERLREIAAAANAAIGLEEILRLVHDAVMEIGGFDRVGVWLAESGGLRGAWGTDTEGRLRDEHPFFGRPEDYTPELSQIIRGERLYAMKDTPFLPLIHLEQLPKAKYLHFSAMGLFARGALIGLILVDNLLTGHALQEKDIEALLPFCEQAAVAIGNARLLQEQQIMMEQQRRLMEISAAISRSLELDAVLRMVRKAIVEAGGFDRAGVFRIENDVIFGSWGTDAEGRERAEHSIRLPVKEGHPLIGPLIRGKEAYMLEDTLAEPLPSGERVRVRRAFIALRTGAEVVGLLSVDRLLSGRPVTEENVQALLPFAEQAAVAIRNARMMEDRKRLIDRQQHLARLAAAISSQTELNDILRLVRNAIVEAAGFDRAAVFLLDPDKRHLRGTWGTDREGQLERIDQAHYEVPDETNEWPLWRGIRGNVDYVLTRNLTRQFKLSRDNSMYGVTHHAIVPLKAGTEIVGVIAADNVRSKTPITDEEVRVLLPFAEQTAVAIQNARLIEQLEQAQTALVHAEKLRAVGELAGGVAHNINNLLTAVLGYAELIQRHKEATPLICNYAQIIAQAGADGAEIVRRVQQFARRDTASAYEAFDLVQIIRESVDLTRPVWQTAMEAKGSQIKVQMELPSSLTTQGIPTEIREVIVNLIMNAVEAMPGGGHLSLSARLENNENVIEVTDTGHGMDEATLQRVFEPFFTTKGPALGTGLGLPLAWGIAERHGGRLEARSAPNVGTTFVIRLPAFSPPAYEAPQQKSIGERSLAGWTILLVEDEEFVAASVARMLQGSGATVKVLDSPKAALAWLQDHAEAFSLVLSDHGMPDMTGLDLLARVRERWPFLRRVLLSGWGAAPPGDVDVSAAEQILTKPIRQSELIAALKKLRLPQATKK